MILKDKKIFLLEDDPVNFAVIKVLLRKSGAIILHDHWGDETLTKIKEFPFSLDLILLDIMLPGKVSGYDIWEEIRKKPDLEGVPVAFVSASDREVEIPKIKAFNGSGYISKPINQKWFAQQVLSIIEGDEVWE